jgi:hypothetical protein
MMVSCQNALGVGIAVPPIINAFNGSSTPLSARAVAAENINTIEAPANSAAICR